MTNAPVIARRPYSEWDIRSSMPTEITPMKAGASSIQKYIIMRKTRLERVHQQNLHQFLQDYGRQYGDVGEATNAYFARFQAAVSQNKVRLDAARTAILNDRNMDYTRKQQSLQRLDIGVDCAWSQERESGFVAQYGDPRTNRNAWNAELSTLDRETVEESNEMKTIVRNRTGWEKMLPWLLAHPELDGSVAPCSSVQSESFPDSAAKTFTQQAFAPPVSDLSIEPLYYEAMMKAAKAVCPHCKVLYARGWKSHERACAKNHNVTSVQDVELPSDLPAVLRQHVTTGDESEPEDEFEDALSEPGDLLAADDEPEEDDS